MGTGKRESDPETVQRASSSVQRKKARENVHSNSLGSLVRSFLDLEAWQVCRDVRRHLTELAMKLPPSEKFRLADQMIRASRSATANLAEGYGRYQYPDMVHFARQARGSLYEALDHLTVALDAGYITQTRFDEEHKHIERAVQVVNGYIRFLRRRQESGQD